MWPDGVRYDGQMSLGRIEGEGTFHYPSAGGMRYQGGVAGGRHHGAGTLTIGEQNRRGGRYAR